MPTLPGGSTLPPPLLATAVPAPSASPADGGRSRSAALAALLVVAVGLAFADASIVVLALPDLYREFDTSVVGVSWVLTAYAIVVTVAALLVALVGRRVRPGALIAAGLVVFAMSSLAAGVAGSFGFLLAARCAQGVGAALLLAGAIPVLAALRGSETSGRAWWAWAGTVGAALGPALGGILTQLLDWRAIFIVQAPVAAAALMVVAAPVVRSLVPTRPTSRRQGRSPPTSASSWSSRPSWGRCSCPCCWSSRSGSTSPWPAPWW